MLFNSPCHNISISILSRMDIWRGMRWRDAGGAILLHKYMKNISIQPARERAKKELLLFLSICTSREWVRKCITETANVLMVQSMSYRCTIDSCELSVKCGGKFIDWTHSHEHTHSHFRNGLRLFAFNYVLIFFPHVEPVIYLGGEKIIIFLGWSTMP